MSQSCRHILRPLLLHSHKHVHRSVDFARTIGLRSLSRATATTKVELPPPVPPLRRRRVEDDSENFWKVAADDSAFWNAYVSTRPNYSDSFYNEIYQHHRTHSGATGVWKVAHDVGCGAGQVAAELSRHFRHVIASDINDTHITVAQRRNAFTDAAGSISYTHCMGEQLAKHHPAESVDLVAAAEAMVLMDEGQALEAFAKLLRPKGTLAFWFYGRPTLSEPGLRSAGQHLINQIMVYNWAKVIRGSGAKRRAGFKRAADGMASWLDYVPFDPNTWTNVQRIKWNSDIATLPFFGREACGFEVDAVSNVRQNEHVEERQDPNWWRNDWSIKQLKQYFAVLFPGFKEAVGDGDAEVQRLFGELEKLMGGANAVHSFTWPAVLVMATKK